MLLRGDDSHFGPAQGISRHRLPQFGRISQKIGVMLHSKPAIVKGLCWRAKMRDQDVSPEGLRLVRILSCDPCWARTSEAGHLARNLGMCQQSGYTPW